ncbi:MAG TPA: ribosome maturation factor RimM [Acidimicrobiales bacterium]|nr:ribosome maturation factor RimM [Acidimicrobiales bacterium]
MTDLLEVARIVKPHGIRGEVIVDLLTDRTERVDAGVVLVGGADHRQFEILASRPHQGRFIVTFAGVPDRSAAEALRGTVLLAEPLDDPDALWVHDLVGAELVDVDGVSHGTVESVQENPAADLLVLSDGRLVPVNFVVSHEPGRVVVDVPKGLLDE